MIIAIACTSILAFLVAFRFLGIIPVASRAIGTAREAGSVMRDPNLDDDAKEAAVQKASLSLFKSFGSLVVRVVLLLLSAFLPIFLADMFGLVPDEAVIGFLLRWDVLVITSVVIIGAVYLGKRLWR